MKDIWASRRELVHDALLQRAEAVAFSSNQLVREQIQASDPADYEMVALACLAAAEAAGGSAKAALPGAVAVAALAQMALVFSGLENSGGAASLSTAWGMPRSLNVGDAFFALAQESILLASVELAAEERLQATRILDASSRALVDALFGASEHADVALAGQRALLPSAMALGGLYAGAGEDVRTQLAQLGREWAQLSPEDLSRRLAGDPSGWLAT